MTFREKPYKSLVDIPSPVEHTARSKNMHDISCDMQAMTTEELKEFAKNQENVKRLLTGAYEAAEAVWKNHPEFKTVLLDTCSKEELVMLQQAKQQKGAQA